MRAKQRACSYSCLHSRVRWHMQNENEGNFGLLSDWLKKMSELYRPEFSTDTEELHHSYVCYHSLCISCIFVCLCVCICVYTLKDWTKVQRRIRIVSPCRNNLMRRAARNRRRNLTLIMLFWRKRDAKKKTE